MQCCAGLSPQQVLQSNMDRWMMISNSLVSLDGTVCNMVGTSYPAFRYQTVRSAACTLAMCYATCEQTKSFTMTLHASDTYLRHDDEATKPDFTEAETWVMFAGWMYAATGDLPGQAAGGLLQCRHGTYRHRHHPGLLCQPLGWRPAWRPAGRQLPHHLPVKFIRTLTRSMLPRVLCCTASLDV